MISVEVLDRIANDVNVGKRIRVPFELLNGEISDSKIVASVQISVSVSSDAHGDLLHPAIIVVTGNVVDADPGQVMNGTILECQERSLRSSRGSGIGSECPRIGVTIECELEFAACRVSARARVNGPVNNVYLLC